MRLGDAMLLLYHSLVTVKGNIFNRLPGLS